MPKIRDISGQKFNHLTPMAKMMRCKHGVLWRCKCDCGGETFAFGGFLRSGRTRSCGCDLDTTRRSLVESHGWSGRPEYWAWREAKARCSRPTHDRWKDYGGRGIDMCQRWRDSFVSFIEDMGPRPPGCSIDRIDVNGNYEPSNCRWTTNKVQMNNRRCSAAYRKAV